MVIYIGADHAGYKLKEVLKSYLEELGAEVHDKGAFVENPEDDYPDFIAPVAKAVSLEPKTARGIVIGRSGQGEAMLANAYPHVRAAVFYGGGVELAELSRKDNNSNVLALGAQFLSDDEARSILKVWLNAPFSYEDKYYRRIDRAEELKRAAWAAK